MTNRAARSCLPALGVLGPEFDSPWVRGVEFSRHDNKLRRAHGGLVSGQGRSLLQPKYLVVAASSAMDHVGSLVTVRCIPTSAETQSAFSNWISRAFHSCQLLQTVQPTPNSTAIGHQYHADRDGRCFPEPAYVSCDYRQVLDSFGRDCHPAHSRVERMRAPATNQINSLQLPCGAMRDHRVFNQKVVGVFAMSAVGSGPEFSSGLGLYAFPVQSWLTAPPSPFDESHQVLHDEQQVIGIARARLEIEMFIKKLGVVVLGMDEQSAGADGVRGLRSTQ